MKNRLAPVNRIPLDVLSLVLDYLDVGAGGSHLIALTHVCRAWREIFISQSSLWTYFECINANKTRIYLERSKSSPINMCLYRKNALPASDPLFQIIPHSVGRLKSLSITTRPGILHRIIAHLPPHAPLLERLDISNTFQSRTLSDSPVTTAIFSGDLPLLRAFRLECIRTELPWRNMVNLTSVVLRNMPPDCPSIRQLLDFFESAPRLCKIKLDSATPAAGGQGGRLVSLAYLKGMWIFGLSPSSLLLDHLLIPVGAKLSTWGDSFHHIIKDHLPGSLDNLKNISNITKIHLRVSDHARIKLSGPSGELNMASKVDAARWGLESLARLDTSKVERLETVSGDHLLTRPSYRGLLPLENLRSLTLFRSRNPYTLMDALNPNTVSSGAMACPKLEEIELIPHTGTEIDIKSVIEVAAARIPGGAKLRTVRIGGKDKLNPKDVLELEKHVLNVERVSVVDEVESDSEDSDEDFW